MQTIGNPEWYHPPDEILMDFETGYSINVPLVLQGYPGWWDDMPGVVARIMDIRQQLGITIDDFPEGKPEPASTPEPAPTQAKHARPSKKIGPR